ncbi:hypothetical protein FB1_02190 [Flavobacterium branchiophilum NBRC 15030 = ATCC 35035]|nr:hypothetical protein FB1_02190 [Flavobacterium branchiophilum NBRC 15030 = ATCC 35035]
MGLSKTLKGLTSCDAIGVNPDFKNSFTPDGYSVLESDICCTISKDTTLITTSFVASQLIRVCLSEWSRTRRAGENTNIGGLALKILKKLKGDKLGHPNTSTVLANAMGLGATAP